MASVLTKDKKTGDFVLVPRKEYEELLGLKKILKNKLSEIKNVDIDHRIAEALADVKTGRVYGPFNSAKEFIKSLHGKEKKKAISKQKK